MSRYRKGCEGVSGWDVMPDADGVEEEWLTKGEYWTVDASVECVRGGWRDEGRDVMRGLKLPDIPLELNIQPHPISQCLQELNQPPAIPAGTYILHHQESPQQAGIRPYFPPSRVQIPLFSVCPGNFVRETNQTHIRSLSPRARSHQNHGP